jgi:hypothetical protein
MFGEARMGAWGVIALRELHWAGAMLPGRSYRSAGASL